MKIEKLKDTKVGYMYEVEFMAWPENPEKCYFFICTCVDVKNDEVIFDPKVVKRQGNVATEDLYQRFSIDDLEYIEIREIGSKKDFPEFCL